MYLFLVILEHVLRGSGADHGQADGPQVERVCARRPEQAVEGPGPRRKDPRLPRRKDDPT